MSTCVATHVTWTTYMTWPPGDRRGHWGPLFDLYGRLIDAGHHLNLPDPTTVRVATERANEPERVLTPADQQIVADTVGDVLRELPDAPPVFASAVERTHTHLLLGTCRHPINSLVGRIKGRTSAEVIARGSEPWRTRTWTAEYWHVFVFDLAVVSIVQRYIERHNVRRGLAPAPYPWIEPFVR